jgi:hypothetical protein
MKIFLACAKGMPQSDVDVKRKDVQRYLSMKNKKTVQVVPSGEDFQTYFAQCGGWSEWIEHVTRGVDYTTRKQIYDAVVCVDTQLGKATAGIIEKALEAGKPALYWDPQSTPPMKRITSVKTVDETDWTGGWSFNTL